MIHANTQLAGIVSYHIISSSSSLLPLPYLISSKLALIIISIHLTTQLTAIASNPHLRYQESLSRGEVHMCNPTNHHLPLLFIIIIIVVVVTFTGIAIALHNFPKTIVLAETKLLTNVHSQKFVIRSRFWLSFLFFWKIHAISRRLQKHCKHQHLRTNFIIITPTSECSRLNSSLRSNFNALLNPSLVKSRLGKVCSLVFNNNWKRQGRFMFWIQHLKWKRIPPILIVDVCFFDIHSLSLHLSNIHAQTIDPKRPQITV